MPIPRFYQNELEKPEDQTAKPDPAEKPPVPGTPVVVSPPVMAPVQPQSPQVQPTEQPLFFAEEPEDEGNDIEDDPIFDLLVAFLQINPDPSDQQIALLAGSIGMELEELNHALISIIQAMIEDPELSEELRSEISTTLNSGE